MPLACPHAAADAASTTDQLPESNAPSSARVSCVIRGDPGGAHELQTLPPSCTTIAVCSPTPPQRAQSSKLSAHPPRANARSKDESSVEDAPGSRRASERSPPTSSRYESSVEDAPCSRRASERS